MKLKKSSPVNLEIHGTCKLYPAPMLSRFPLCLLMSYCLFFQEAKNHLENVLDMCLITSLPFLMVTALCPDRLMALCRCYECVCCLEVLLYILSEYVELLLISVLFSFIPIVKPVHCFY